jgi:hypothetical protein
MTAHHETSLAVVNGAVHTMERTQPLAEAVLLRGDRIQAVGSTDEIRALAPANTVEVNAAGHTVLPGLNDAHLHFVWFGLSLQRLRLADTVSLEQVQQRVAVAAPVAGAGAWVLGRGWNHNLWSVPTMPTRQDLDLVSENAPVALGSKDGHAIWCNSAALRLAGIDQNTPDPTGGRILRDVSGWPTGVLADAAIALVERVMPAPSNSEREQAALVACQAALALGVTSVQSCEGPDEFSALAKIEQEDRLGVRVWHMVPLESLPQALAMGLRTGFGSERLRIGHVKMFADGALGSATAEMLAPYEGAPDNLGVAVTSTKDLLAAARDAARGGLACAIHAIGDLANQRVLDVYEALQRELPALRYRQRIEHVQLINPRDVARLARLGVVASMQPIHSTQDIEMADRQWGARTQNAYVFRDLLTAGATLAFGTDCPVEALDPLAGLYAAVTRQHADGTPQGGWHPAQRLTLDEALYAYTMGAAYASYQEQLKGSLTPGKWADLVVLSTDIHAADPEALLTARAELTISGGQVVHTA